MKKKVLRHTTRSLAEIMGKNNDYFIGCLKKQASAIIHAEKRIAAVEKNFANLSLLQNNRHQEIKGTLANMEADSKSAFESAVNARMEVTRRLEEFQNRDSSHHLDDKVIELDKRLRYLEACVQAFSPSAISKLRMDIAKTKLCLKGMIMAGEEHLGEEGK